MTNFKPIEIRHDAWMEPDLKDGCQPDLYVSLCDRRESSPPLSTQTTSPALFLSQKATMWLLWLLVHAIAAVAAELA